MWNKINSIEQIEKIKTGTKLIKTSSVVDALNLQDENNSEYYVKEKKKDAEEIEFEQLNGGNNILSMSLSMKPSNLTYDEIIDSGKYWIS